MCVLFFFFFKQKTAYEMRISDWSSDVCSSDLQGLRGDRQGRRHVRGRHSGELQRARQGNAQPRPQRRTQERRDRRGRAARNRGGVSRFSPSPDGRGRELPKAAEGRSEEHTSELQSLMRSSYAVFCLKNKKN